MPILAVQPSGTDSSGGGGDTPPNWAEYDGESDVIMNTSSAWSDYLDICSLNTQYAIQLRKDVANKQMKLDLIDTTDTGSPVKSTITISSVYAAGRLVKLSETSCLFVYDNHATHHGEALVIARSGASISAGSATAFLSSSIAPGFLSVAVNPAGTRAYVAYSDPNDSDKGYIQELSISGTTVTKTGSAGKFHDAWVGHIIARYVDAPDGSTERVLIGFRCMGRGSPASSFYGSLKARVAVMTTATGGSSFGTLKSIRDGESAGVGVRWPVLGKVDDALFGMAWIDMDEPATIAVTSGGTTYDVGAMVRGSRLTVETDNTITATSPTTIYNAWCDFLSGVGMEESGQFLIFGRQCRVPGARLKGEEGFMAAMNVNASAFERTNLIEFENYAEWTAADKVDENEVLFLFRNGDRGQTRRTTLRRIVYG